MRIRNLSKLHFSLAPLLAAQMLFSSVANPVPDAQDNDALRGSVEYSTPERGRVRVDFDIARPPGLRVDIGTHRMHLFCIGSGKTTVLMDAGLGGFSLEWLKIQTDLAADTRVCTYDRAGYGWSDSGPHPRTSARIVDELYRLLAEARETGPFILVGHSFGGYTMQLFAKRFPERTRGLVLVDSSHPEQSARLPRRAPPSNTRGGRRRLMSWPVVPANFPYQARAVAYYLMHRPASVRTQRLELNTFAVSGRQVAGAGQIPPVPVIVLSRGERVWPNTGFGDEMEARWRELQSELANQGAAPRLLKAPFSGHYVHLDQPWLVEDAIREILFQSDTQRKLARR